MEAADKCKENGTIDLMTPDVMIPTMNGREAHGLRENVRRGIRTLFASGYDEDIIQNQGLLESGANRILRPASLKELPKRAREDLDAYSLHNPR